MQKTTNQRSTSLASSAYRSSTSLAEETSTHDRPEDAARPLRLGRSIGRDGNFVDWTPLAAMSLRSGLRSVDLWGNFCFTSAQTRQDASQEISLTSLDNAQSSALAAHMETDRDDAESSAPSDHMETDDQDAHASHRTRHTQIRPSIHRDGSFVSWYGHVVRGRCPGSRAIDASGNFPDWDWANPQSASSRDLSNGLTRQHESQKTSSTTSKQACHGSVEYSARPHACHGAVVDPARPNTDPQRTRRPEAVCSIPPFDFSDCDEMNQTCLRVKLHTVSCA